MRALAIDVIGLTGYGSLLWGLWQVYEPAAPIVGGSLALLFAAVAGRPTPSGGEG